MADQTEQPNPATPSLLEEFGKLQAAFADVSKLAQDAAAAYEGAQGDIDILKETVAKLQARSGASGSQAAWTLKPGADAVYVGEKETAGAEGEHHAVITNIKEDGTADLLVFFRGSTPFSRLGVPEEGTDAAKEAPGFWKRPA